MNERELERYLHERIPLSRAMAVTVRAAGAGGVELHAPLEPNINHRDTVFGGSAASVATLAAWSVLLVRLQADGLRGRIVIRRSSMSYDKPITAGFTATADAPGDEAWARLTATLARGRVARIRVAASLSCENEPVGEFDGEFAILPP